MRGKSNGNSTETGLAGETIGRGGDSNTKVGDWEIFEKRQPMVTRGKKVKSLVFGSERMVKGRGPGDWISKQHASGKKRVGDIERSGKEPACKIFGPPDIAHTLSTQGGKGVSRGGASG